MSTKLRLLLVTSTFPYGPEDRVTARFVLDLAVHLATHARVFVLAPAAPTSEGRERWGDVTVMRHRYFYPASAQRLTGGEGILATMGHDRLAKAQLPMLIGSQWAWLPLLVRREKIDAVNSHWLVPQGLNVALWRRRLGVVHIATAHAADVAFLRRSKLGPPVTRYLMRRTDCFLPVSSHLARGVAELVGRDVPHQVVPMGVSDTVFRPDASGAEVRAAELREGERLILFVGKLVPKKGLIHLVDAMALLRQRQVSARLLIVGGGPLEETIRARVAELGLEQVVRLVGWRHNSELPGHYAAADVVCVPSVIDERGETEGMPVVVQEALASGSIIVASNLSGIPDVIQDGQDGLLVPPGDAASLADTLERALDMDAASRDAMSRAARRKAARHTWERVAERYLEAIEEAIRVARPRT